MKNLKLLCLAAFSLAVVAAAAPGAASGTVLCKDTNTPCNSDYASGTTIDAENATTITFEYFSATVRCGKTA